MIPPPPDTTSAVQHRAAAAPQEPWLFFRPALDWRWCSWGQMAAAMAAGAEALAVVPEGCRVGFTAELTPASVAAALAIEASGRWSIPRADPSGPLGTESPPRSEAPALPEGLGLTEYDAHVQAAGEAPATAASGFPVVTLPAIPAGVGTPAPAAASPAEEGGGGGAGIRHPGGALRLWPVQELAGQAREAFREVEPPRRRDILLAAVPADGAAARMILTWSALSGAALVLEPSAMAWPATLRWARPTILAGTAQEVRRGCQAFGPPHWRRSLWRHLPWSSNREERKLRPPLDRLRAVVVLGEEPLEPEEQDYWRSLGIALLQR